MTATFTVLGHPEPQGSSKAFIPKGWSRAVITGANSKNKPWRQQVAGCALTEMNGNPPTPEAISVKIAFYFLRPKSVSKKITHKTTKPDIDKLARSVLDALTGICYVDDSQVVEISVGKYFGIPERAEIQISPAAEQLQMGTN